METTAIDMTKYAGNKRTKGAKTAESSEWQAAAGRVPRATASGTVKAKGPDTQSSQTLTLTDANCCRQ